jgi:CRISPR/Cas system CSM-associated protein Csm4 (group 5 of RAMP superfamily)
MVYQQGESALQDFLEQMGSSQPPLILADPFPAGYLPMPVLPNLAASQHRWFTEQIRQMGCEEVSRKTGYQFPGGSSGNPTRPEAFDVIKKLTKIKWIPREIFHDCQDGLSFESLFEKIVNQGIKQPVFLQQSLVPHNVVDRLGGGTVEGGIFFTENSFYPDDFQFDLLAGTESYTADELQLMLTEALQGGYGRDKSTGCGTIEVGKVAPVNMVSIDNADAVMLLGPCVPAADNPTDGYWQIRGKAGKLGGHWAIDHHPDKHTIMMLTAGSVLLTDQPCLFYGRMVSDVHPYLDEVVHYGLAPALPVRISEVKKEVS